MKATLKIRILRRRIAYLVCLALTVTACTEDVAPCLKGARICSGDRILLCDPNSGTFIEEMRCPPGGTCAGGQCVGRTFPPADASGSNDVSQEQDSATTIADTIEPETTTPDTTPLTDLATDSNAADTEPVTEDTHPVDLQVHDTQPKDSGTSPDATPLEDTNPDNAPSGVLAYSVVPNLSIQDDIRKVAWHPTGSYALALGLKGQVAKIDATTWTTSLLVTLGKQVTDLDRTSDGTIFAIVGRDTADKGTCWLYDSDTGDILAVPIPSGEPIAIVREPGTDRFAIAARHSNNINMLYTYDLQSGLSAPKGYNGPGVTDLMWGLPSLTPGSANIITSDGLGGAGSQSWILATNTVISNGWPASFGNPGGAAWKPNGSYGLITGTSSNKVYVYNGAWEKGTLPVGTAASPNRVAWRSDGKRALIVGRAIGTPLSATVIEHRPDINGDFGGLFVDQSIINFDTAPFFGHGNMHLLDVAWRPGTPCDEGLIVGSDKGASFNPAFGLIIHFYDTGDPACIPPL